MEELSIEDKAKRYDEAIEKAEKWHNAPNVDKIPTFGNRIIEDIFPELHETEDEEVRKEIIKFVNCYYGATLACKHTVSKDKMLAWLEKQGEQKPAEWHIEDEHNLNACLGYIPDEFLKRWLKDIIHIKYDKPIDKVEFEQQQEPTPDHWKDARERAAIAAMQGYMSCKCQLVGTINLAMAEGIAEQAILIADALVKKLKGE